MNDRCLVIAEAGVNHNGSIELAYRLIEAARDAKADIVKFQTFRAETLASTDAPKAAYQKVTDSGGESQFDMLKRLELPYSVFRDLAGHCARVGIGFLSTPFDIAAAEFLGGLGMSHFKISSGDLTNLPFLRGLGSMGLPTILSTGMATLGEVENALEVLERAGLKDSQITLLHCTTEYPAPVEEVNLLAMLTMGRAFPGIEVGYSDHTDGIDISIAAAALGARILEKHFTLDKTMAGPDHRASLEPQDLAGMVKSVHRVCQALGDGRKRPTPSELPNRAIARKSIVVVQPIRQGEIFSTENLTTRRPGNGMSPMRWDDVVGTPAPRDYQTGEML